MRDFHAFFRDERGDAIKSITLMAGAVALASIFATTMLDHASQDGVLARLLPSDSDKIERALANLPRPQQVARNPGGQVTVDYTPTGSIPNSLFPNVTLDPCTGAQK